MIVRSQKAGVQLERVRSRGGATVAVVFFICICTLFVTISTAFGQSSVQGIVINETTGQPQPRVALTLIKFAGGMSPVGEVYSGADGSFSFQKPLPEAAGQPMRGMLRAEFEGVPYSELIRSGAPTGDLRVSVYSVSSRDIPPPASHVVIVEPGSEEMVVNETFLYNNTSQPPRSFRDAERGTLRFYLPLGARDIVQASLVGPAGMPLKSTAEKTSDPNIFKVDFPLKPGENRIDLTYLVPYQEGAEFESRVLYSGLKTRIAAPEGVTVDGEGLQAMGREPRTQASLYETLSDEPYKLVISGQGRLGPAAGSASAGEAGGGGGSLRVAPAPIKGELLWVLVLTCGILAVGFYHLLTSKTPATPRSNGTQPQAAKASGDGARTGKSGSRSARRRR